MPERNLVTFVMLPRNWQLGAVLCLIVSLQLGCSKLGGTAIRDLVKQQPEVSAWHQPEEDSLEQQFLKNPESFETLTAENAVSLGKAEYVADETDSQEEMADLTTETKPVRLTATSPVNHDDESTACATGQCKNSCCNSGTAVPKLPFAEPIEPPPETSGPPRAIISQPLTPIVLKSPERNEVSASQNGLRTDGSFDREAGLRTSQIADPDSAPYDESRKVVSNSIRIGSLNRNGDLRGSENNQSPHAPELPVSSSETFSRRRVSAVTEPVPPFADCPPPDEPSLGGFAPPIPTGSIGEQALLTDEQPSSGVSVAANSFAPPQTVSTLEQAPSTIRVEDLGDEEFNELFGMPGVAVKQELKQMLKKRMVCKSCGKFDCTGCFAPTSAAPVAEIEIGNDREIDFFPTPQEQDLAQPIAETNEPEPFVPFEDDINRLASQVIPASHQETITPVSAASDSSTDPGVSDLRLLNAEFCTEIKGFGQIKRFPNRKFSPQQRVLIYCEVENHDSVRMQTPDGEKFQTRLRGRYQIVDGLGRVVQHGEFPNVEDVALNKRRDFYLFFPIAFQDLPAGIYRLELQVEDLTASRTANVNPSMEFVVE